MRLAALRDAPYAFGSTYEAEQGADEGRWRAGITGRARFVAESEGDVVGTVACGESTSRGTAALTSLWVEPRARRRGTARALVDAVLAWAKDSGYRHIVLWVVEGNANAERLYERSGFKRTGAVQTVRPGDARVEYEMERAL